MARRNTLERDVIRRVQNLANSLEPQVQRQVLQALQQVMNAIPLNRLESVLKSANVFALHDLTASLPAALQPASKALEQLFAQGVNAGQALLPEPVRIKSAFNSLALSAQAAAKESAAKLVTAVTNETRAAIRALVADGFKNGVPPRVLARQIKPLVGLTRGQAKAVSRLRSDLVKAGLALDKAEAKVAKYSEQLRRKRSLTIARTEVIRASTDGQIAAWNNAVSKGLLPANAEKVWITTPDDALCNFCAALDGTTAVLGTKFQTLLGRVDGPPLHPNCRCAISVMAPLGKKPASMIPPQRRFSAQRAVFGPAQQGLAEAQRAAAKARAIQRQATAMEKDAAKRIADRRVQEAMVAKAANDAARAAQAAAEHAARLAATKAAEAAAAAAKQTAKKVLTPEQYAKKQAMWKKYRERMKGLKAQIAAPTPPPQAWPISDKTTRHIGRHYPSKVEADYQSWVRSLSPLEHEAIRNYTGSSYIDMNRTLRGQADYTSLKPKIDAMQGALLRANAPKPELVWRGLSNQGSVDWANSVANGDVVSLKGFQSTSIDPGMAANWGSKVLLEIKPMKGAYVRQLGVSGEYEFVLPHNLKYKVVGRTKVNILSRTGARYEREIIQLEMLP